MRDTASSGANEQTYNVLCSQKALFLSKNKCEKNPMEKKDGDVCYIWQFKKSCNFK